MIEGKIGCDADGNPGRLPTARPPSLPIGEKTEPATGIGRVAPYLEGILVDEMPACLRIRRDANHAEITNAQTRTWILQSPLGTHPETPIRPPVARLKKIELRAERHGGLSKPGFISPPAPS